MQNQEMPPAEQPASKLDSITLLKLVIARHPYASAAFFLVYWFAMSSALGRLLSPLPHLLPLPLMVYDTLAELGLALIVALPLALLRWWSKAGFTRGIDGSGLLICLLPILLIAGPALLSLPAVAGASPLLIISSTLLTLLVGFAEEGMFRGILVNTVLPKGIWTATLVSATCFALIHLSNVLSGFGLGYVLGQVVLAFGTGVLFAALRLRTRSIWPALLLHAVRDVIGLIYLGIDPALATVTPSTAAYIVNFVFCGLFLLIAVVLLRPTKVRELRVLYGLGTWQPGAATLATPLPDYTYAQAQQGYQPYQAYPPASQTPPIYPQAGQLPPASPQALPQTPMPYEIAYHEYTSPAAYSQPETPQPPTPSEPASGQPQE